MNFKKWFSWLRQTDYWSMSDKELDRLAGKYNIPSMSLPPGDSNWGHAYVDRDRIIGIFVLRDNTLRTHKVAVIALAISLGSLAVSIVGFFRK